MLRVQTTRRIAVALGAFAIALSIFASAGFRRELSLVGRHVPGEDLTGHFVLTGLVAFFAVLGFGAARVRGRRLGAAGIALVVATFVTIDEVAQLVLPHRSFSLDDLAASYAGILVFATVAWIVRRLQGAEPPA